MELTRWATIDLCGIRKVARQRAAQRSVRLVVQRAGAVVQQQDLRVSRKGAGQQHALFLPAAQVGAFCGQLSGKTALTLCNEIRLRRACRRSSLLRGNSPPEVDVFTDFIRVEKVVLKHHAELAVQHLGRNGTNVASVQPYRAAVRVVKTQQQPRMVVFPLPVGPMMPSVWPRFREKLTSESVSFTLS